MAILADLALKTTALLVLAAAAAVLMRHASAASRHLVWTGMFGAVLLLPVARLALPAIRLAVLAAETPQPIVLTTPSVTDLRVASVSTATTAIPALGTPPVSVSVSASPAPRTVAWIANQFLAAIWIAGVSLIGLRAVLAATLVRRLGRRARLLRDGPIVERLDRIRLSLRVRRPIRILVSPRQWMPVTWGLFRPAILLPSSVVSWSLESSERLDAVLAHEAAHIARWDALSQFIAKLGVAMFWFNPLMWIAARRARLERERACDDAVVALGTKPSDYAGHLLDIARSLRTPAVRSSGALAMARHSQLDRRIRAILDERVSRRGASRASLWLTSALMVATLPVSAVRLTARVPPIAASIPGMDDVAPPVAPLRQAAPMAQVPVDSPQTIIQAEPSRPPAQQASADSPQLAQWRKERLAMLQQLFDRATRHWKASLIKVEIGTMAAVDTVAAETTLARVEQAVLAEQGRPATSLPSDAEVASVRQRFADAMRKLDALEVRFDSGLATIGELNAAVLAAAALVVSPPSTTAGNDLHLQTFYLAHTNVPEVAQIVNQLLTTTATGSRPTVTMDKSLNALVVRATAPTLQLIQNIIDAVDRPAVQRGAAAPDAAPPILTGQDQYLQTFYLAHADVQEVAQILNQMLTTTAAGSRPTITMHRATNAILVRATAPTLDLIRNIIESVDKPAKTAEAPMTDAALIGALKNAAAIASDADRANTLIALARRNAMTPEMVALYVAAAGGVKSETDRARVFAQPVRVKPPGR